MTTATICTVEDLYQHSPQLTTVPMAVVALGANLTGVFGAPADTLRAVLPALQSLSASPLVMSAIIETEPENCPPGSPRFANAVVVLSPFPDVGAIGFLHKLQQLELEFGRRRKGVLNEARVLDLDLISFGAQVLDTEFLTLPHPRARQRLFVMQPLASIWPSFCFPDDPLSAAAYVCRLQEQ